VDAPELARELTTAAPGDPQRPLLPEVQYLIEAMFPDLPA